MPEGAGGGLTTGEVEAPEEELELKAREEKREREVVSHRARSGERARPSALLSLLTSKVTSPFFFPGTTLLSSPSHLGGKRVSTSLLIGYSAESMPSILPAMSRVMVATPAQGGREDLKLFSPDKPARPEVVERRLSEEMRCRWSGASESSSLALVSSPVASSHLDFGGLTSGMALASSSAIIPPMLTPTTFNCFFSVHFRCSQISTTSFAISLVE